MAITYISIGSNLNDKVINLKNSIFAIQKEVGEIIAESSIYESEAEGFDGNLFLNQIIKIETTLLPEQLLQKTEEIERKLGRTQKTEIKNGKPVYENRIIDIDILLYDDLQIDTETLTIPHPRMLEREFVMKPLREIMNG